MATLEGKEFGSYRLTRLLGRGGFAEVYLGEHTLLGTPAAIKVLHAELSSGEDQSFQREAKTIASLQHPNIVRVLDYDIQDGKPYLVMSYAAQGTLRSRHRRGQQVPLEMVRGYVKQVADALQYAHDQKLVHRDIKPENMLLDERGAVLLSDFGIAVAAHSTRYQNQEVVGTITYMAPEQIQASARPASDQYSLAVVIYEWLTGERPFTGSMAEIATKHLAATPPPLREKLPDLPPAVEEVVLTALAKDPKARFGTVRAFANAFEQACQVQPAQPPVSRSQPLPGGSGPALPVLTPSTAQQTPPVGELVEAAADNAPTAFARPDPATSGPADLTAPVEEAPAKASEEAPAPPPRRFSRRAVVLAASAGLAGLTLAGAGLAWYEVTHPSGPSGVPPTLLVNVPPGVPRLKKALLTYSGHGAAVHSVVWSPDGTLIASASADRTVQVWDSTSGKTTLVYNGHKDSVECVAWSPNGVYLASASWDGTVQVWNANNGTRLLSYTGHSGRVNVVVWAPNGQILASGGVDGRVQVWDLQGNTAYSYLGQSDGVLGLDWSPDGTQIASSDYNSDIDLWTPGPNTPVNGKYTEQIGAINAVAWAPDGALIASASGNVKLWNPKTQQTKLTYLRHSAYVSSVAWTKDATRIVSASADQSAHVWDAQSGIPLLIYLGHTAEVNTARWSPDYRRVASGGNDNTVQVWRSS